MRRRRARDLHKGGAEKREEHSVHAMNPCLSTKEFFQLGILSQTAYEQQGRTKSMFPSQHCWGSEMVTGIKIGPSKEEMANYNQHLLILLAKTAIRGNKEQRFMLWMSLLTALPSSAVV